MDVHKAKYASSAARNGPPLKAISLTADVNALLASELSLTSLSKTMIRELGRRYMGKESDLTSNLEAINELIGNLAVDSLQDILGGIDDALVLNGRFGELTSAVWSC